MICSKMIPSELSEYVKCSRCTELQDFPRHHNVTIKLHNNINTSINIKTADVYLSR